MIFHSNEQWEKKAKTIRSYTLPINEDRMNSWIIKLRLVVDLGWLNESDIFAWAQRDCEGHPSMREG